MYQKSFQHSQDIANLLKLNEDMETFHTQHRETYDKLCKFNDEK